ncbi:MAG TPA: hypothetical protein VK995_04675, partial [Oceanipulchritudo sp.]|nr:hypothetical protein [Oceanipulchritudo sp.]
VTAEGERLDDAVAVSIERIGELTASDKEFVAGLPLNQKTKASMRNVYKVSLSRAVELMPGAVVASNNRMGKGFAVKDCRFGNNRSRGILIKASDGEISGNELINTHMQSIKIAPEYHWLESGFSRNVTIMNNTIINPGREAIQIRGIGAFPGHENIRVLDNVVRTDVSPAMRIESVTNGRVAGNEIFNLDGSPLTDFIEVKFCQDLELP